MPPSEDLLTCLGGPLTGHARERQRRYHVFCAFRGIASQTVAPLWYPTTQQRYHDDIIGHAEQGTHPKRDWCHCEGGARLTPMRLG